MALTYSQVLDRYDRARAFGDTRSLPDYAKGLNDLYDTQDFSAGLRDGPWTRFSTRADQFLGNTVGQVTGPIGEAFGGAFGNPEAGRRVGEGLPRALLQSAPLYALGPEAGLPATIAALGGTGALFGAQTYADTGSPKAALYSGLTAAALPQLGKFAGNLGARAFGGSRVAGELGGNAFNEVLPETGSDAFRVGAGRFLGSQGAQIGAQLGSQIAQNRAMGGDESWSDALTSPDFWLNQIPFTVYDAVHAARTSVPTAESIRPQLTQPQRTAEVKPYVPPPAAPEQQAQLDSLIDGFRAVQGDPNATPEDRAAALRAVVNHTFEAPSQTQEPVAQPEPTVAIQGQADKIGNGNYRVLVTGHNDIINGPKIGSTVFINGVEPDVNGVFHAKPSQVGTATFQLAPKPVLDSPANPVLSERPEGVEPTQPLETPAVTPELTNADVEGLTALGVPPEKIVGFTTSKGSTYTLEGSSTQRTKTLHEGHDVKDVGLKEPSQHTVYVDPDLAAEIGMWQTSNFTNKQVGLNPDGSLDLTSVNPDTGVRGRDVTIAPAKYSTTPEVGKSPLELWKQDPQSGRFSGNHPGNPIVELKKSVASYELAKQTETSAREAATSVPTKAEEWTQSVDPVKGKDQIQEHVEKGTTPTQAVESARLQSQTPIVDESVVEQNVAHDQVHKVVSEGQEQNQYGGALLDDQGNRRKWRNPAAAEAWLETYRSENKADDRAFATRSDGRGFYYLAPKENVYTHYDTNAEGQGMENVLGTPSDIDSIMEANEGNLGKEAKESELAATPVEDRADISRQSVLNNLNVAARNSEAFAEFVDPDIIEDSPQNLVTKAQIALTQGTEGLAKVNEVLKARGIGPFKSEREMTTQMRELMRGAAMFQDRYRNVALGSVVPGDASVLPQGTLDSVSNLAAHIASRKEMGVVADLMDAIVKSGVLPKDTRLQLPTSEGHDPLGWWMHSGREGLLEPLLNIPHYPESVTDSSWLMNAAHELVHLSEVQLSRRDDPAANDYRTQRDSVLEVLRKSKIVPKRVRETVAQLVKDNSYQWLLDGHLDPNELRTAIKQGIGKENSAYFSYVYAMLHPQEMTATLFSDPKMVAIAEQTPMKQGIVKSALTFLSNAFNKLVGGNATTETALSTMLKSYDNYLTGGIMRKVYNGANFVRDGLVAQGVRPDALASRMQTVDRMFARGTLDASVAGYQREANAGLLPATVNEGPVEPKVLDALRAPEASAPYDATMELLADQLPVHQDLLWRMSQDLDLTEKLVKAVKSGEVPGSLPPNVEANLSLSRAKVNSMRKAMQKQALALARWNKLDQFDPQGWEASVADGLTQKIRSIEPPDEVPDANEVRKLVGIERLAGGGINPIAKNFMLTTQLKELVPETKPVFTGVNDEQGKAHARAVTLNGAYVYDPATQNLSKEIKTSNDRVAASEPMTQAVSDIFRWQNKEGGAKALNLKDPAIVKTLARFNPSDRDAILQTIRSQWQRHHVWADKVLPPALAEINRDNTGMLIAARETGMLPDQARDLATQVYNGLASASSQDQVEAQVGAAQLKALSAKMQPDTFFAALKHAQTLSESTANWIQRIRDNPGYTTEQRYGSDRLVMMSPKGDKFMTSGTRDALQKIQSDKASQGYEFMDYIKAEDKANPSFGMREETLQALDQLDSSNQQIVAELLKDQPDVAARILPRIQRAGDIRASIAASGPLPTVKRNFVEGREYINMVDNANQFYVRMNNWLRNKATRSRTTLDMMHPQVEGNTEVQNLLNQHVNNFLSPDNPLARKIVEATYFYKLAFDMGNTMLEMTQNLTTGMAGLIQESGSVGDSMGLWGGAVKDIISHKATGKWADPELASFINTVSTQGQLGRPSWSDIVDPDVAQVMHSNGGGIIDTVKNSAMSFASRFTGFNDTISLIAAFKLGRSQGMSVDDATKFAVDVKQRSLFTGGKQQRPVGLWSIKTKPVPQLLGALQTYSLGWLGQLAENYTKGFGKAPEGLTPTQRTGAKKAFVYMIMAQAALAGALGLPGVGQGLALLGQATDTDPKGWLRQNLAKLFDEDQGAGGVLTSLALRGVGSAGLPFDPSSRASVSIPFLGVDAYKGFDVANLGGAATSTVSDFAKGLLGLMHGDTTAATSLLPNVAKRPYQLWQGEGDIRDTRGGLQVQLSPAERFAMAVGVTPSRVQTERDTSEALKKANLAAERQQASFVDGLATQVRNGQTAEVQQALIQYVKDHPDANPKALVQAVASRVEAQTVPYDWRRDLNPGVQLAGLTSAQPSNELQRRQIRQSVSASLGVPSYANPAEDYRAALMDQMLNSDPTMVRSTARKAVSGTPPVRTPYTWLNN